MKPQDQVQDEQPAPRGGEGAGASDAPIEIEITGAAVDAEWLARMLEAAVRRVRRPVRRVALRLVGETEMTALHERFLGRAGPTDVITFPMASGADEPLDVDIAVCVDVARAQAGRRGHPVAHEILLYAVHGLLHEAGYDDGEDGGAAAMHAEEDRILREIGVGAVYGRGEGAA